MRVRSFELGQVAESDLRKLHDYLLEVGGFEFRAGGSGFFVLVGERFTAPIGSSHAQMIMAAREADTISVDVVAAGGRESDGSSHQTVMHRLSELLRGFAEREQLPITDI